MFDWLKPRDRTATEQQLTQRIDRLEKQVEALDVEWSEWYDKYRRLYARISKRAERDGDAEKGNGSEHSDVPLRVNQRIMPRNLRGF